MFLVNVWQFLPIFIICEGTQGVSRFIIQPRNKTVNYGEFVEFECQVDVGNHNHALELYFGSINIFPDSFNRLNSREFFAGVNGTYGKVWIIVNNKTIQQFKYFWCSVVYNHQRENSDSGYLDVMYPECTPCLHQTNTVANFVSLTTQLPILLTSTQMPQLTSTSPELKLCMDDLGKEKMSNNGTIFFYQVAFGICLSLILLLLVILAVILVCIYVKGIHKKPTVNSTDRICNALIHNPIYDGPVYESVQPQFETLTATIPQLSATSNTSTEQHSLLLDIAESDSRYVTHTSQDHSPIPQQDGSHSPKRSSHYQHTNSESHKEPSACCIPHTEAEPSKTNRPPSQNNNEMSSDHAITYAKDWYSKEKDDMYTVMNSAGTLSGSLSGEWGELSHVAKKGCNDEIN